jgi:hypothetical protein
MLCETIQVISRGYSQALEDEPAECPGCCRHHCCREFSSVHVSRSAGTPEKRRLAYLFPMSISATKKHAGMLEFIASLLPSSVEVNEKKVRWNLKLCVKAKGRGVDNCSSGRSPRKACRMLRTEKPHDRSRGVRLAGLLGGVTRRGHV